MRKFVFNTSKPALMLTIILGWIVTAYPIQSRAANGQFEADICWFKAPINLKADCGYLSVAERYEKAEGRLLKLPVVIFNPDIEGVPVLYIDGGPGSDSGISHQQSGRSWEQIIQSTAFLTGRKVILMAQRGTADDTSTALKCPSLGHPRVRIGLSYAPRDTLDLEGEIKKRLLSCRQDALDAGYDLSAYSTMASTQDLITLRRALNIEKWDIAAVSYGSRLAFLLTGQDADHIRSLVIDGPDVPGEHSSFEVATRLSASFDQMQMDCNAIAGCKRRFPDMRNYLGRFLEHIADDPPWSAFRRQGESRIYYIKLTQERVMNALYNGFYTTEAVALMPRALLRAARKDYSIMGALSGSILLDPFHEDRSYGMALSVDCTEFDKDHAFSVLDQQEEIDPLFAAIVRSRRKGLSRLCPLWLGDDYVPQPTSLPTQALQIPMLILSGHYDPITPIAALPQALREQENIQIISIAGMGHGVLFKEDCSSEIAQSFFTDPAHAADTSCLSRIDPYPAFNLNTAPPRPEPFIEMKSYDSRSERRTQ